jgi:hypothetical protein
MLRLGISDPDIQSFETVAIGNALLGTMRDVEMVLAVDPTTYVPR